MKYPGNDKSQKEGTKKRYVDGHAGENVWTKAQADHGYILRGKVSNLKTQKNGENNNYHCALFHYTKSGDINLNWIDKLRRMQQNGGKNYRREIITYE